MIRPQTPEDLAAALASATAAGHSILLGGAFTKNRMAGPLPHAAETISTAALDRVLQYEPQDLTISVQAGMRWCALQQLLAANRQMIPIDPPFYEEATVGGVVASNTCGPRRRQYGSLRDLIIGMHFATLEGKLVQSGGMVVKNVAGLDMGKLLIGSFGTLAAIAVVNFKLTPSPASSCTFLYETEHLEEAVARRDWLLTSVLQPVAIDLLNPHAAPRVGLEGYVLAVQAAGSPKVVERYARDLDGWRAVDDEQESHLWERIREFTPHFLAEHEQGTVVRLSGVLTDLEPMAGALHVPVVARAGSGICYAYFPDCESAARWLQEDARPDWRGLLEFVPPQHCAAGEQWPRPGTDFAVMKKIKEMFDPSHLLNRGRMYGRL